MNKWSQIKQATLDKLYLSESEAQEQYGLQKFQRLANECINSIANTLKPRIKYLQFKVVADDVTPGVNEYHLNNLIKMPSDFLSFSSFPSYLDGVEDPEIVYVTDKDIKVFELGEYIVVYNAIYPEITTQIVQNDTELEIDSSILNVVPTYIAWNLLSQDDPQRSMILKNEYELMLARIDNDVRYQEKHYKSTGGWY